MLLYILYTTYVASHNKELFSIPMLGSSTQKSNTGLFSMVTSLLGQQKSQSTQSKPQIQTVANPFEKKKKNISATSTNPIGFLTNLMPKTTSLSFTSSKPSTSVSTNPFSNSAKSFSFFTKKSNSAETIETFTPQEMKAYPQMLKRNCDITSNLHKKLQKSNYNRCGAGAKGKTERDTINNKRQCWDDVRKEIVAGMDAESNCVMASLNKVGSDARADMAEMKFPSRSATKSTPVSSYEVNSGLLGVEEGPNFINKHYMQLFDPRKGAGFAEIGAEQKGKTGKYADINSYNDVGFTSDPAFLYRLSVYNKNKSKAEQFEEYNNQQMNTHANSSDMSHVGYSRTDAYDMAGRLKPDFQ